jgi:hypothetical protein
MTPLPSGSDSLDLRKYRCLEIVRCQIERLVFLRRDRDATGPALLLPSTVHTLDTNSETLMWTQPLTQLSQLILYGIVEDKGGIDSLRHSFPRGPRDMVMQIMPSLKAIHLRRSCMFMKQLAPWMPSAAVDWSESFASEASVSNPCFVKDDNGGYKQDASSSEWSLFYTCAGCDDKHLKCEPRGKCTFVGHRFRGHDVTHRCRHRHMRGEKGLKGHHLLCDACVLCAYCVELIELANKPERSMLGSCKRKRVP